VAQAKGDVKAHVKDGAELARTPAVQAAAAPRSAVLGTTMKCRIGFCLASLLSHLTSLCSVA
jgi:hypothetical protein